MNTSYSWIIREEGFGALHEIQDNFCHSLEVSDDLICTKYKCKALAVWMDVKALWKGRDIDAILQVSHFSSSTSLLLHLLGVWQVCHNPLGPGQSRGQDRSSQRRNRCHVNSHLSKVNAEKLEIFHDYLNVILLFIHI